MPEKLLVGLLLALLIGCDERERLVLGPDQTDRSGPTTRIEPPAIDTTLTEGEPFVVGAQTVDPSGVDTVFIQVEGADLSYLPLDAEGADTLDFSLNLPTLGFAGQTITVGIYGVDVIRNVGPTVIRRLTIE